MKNVLFKSRRAGRGLTLVELLAILAILAILLALAIPFLGAQLKKSQELVCDANRRSIVAELTNAIYQDKTPPTALKDLLLPYKGSCPGGGSYAIQDHGGELYIYCSVHGGDLVEDLNFNFKDLLVNFKDPEKYPDYELHYANNDEFRKYLYKKNGGWPRLVYEDVTYYVQPYVKIESSVKPEPFIFASTFNVETGNWNARLVYLEGIWYYYGTKTYGVANKTATQMAEAVTKPPWVALSSLDYTILPPQK